MTRLSAATLSLALLVGRCNAFSIHRRTPAHLPRSSPASPSVNNVYFPSSRCSVCLGKDAMQKATLRLPMNNGYRDIRQESIRLDAFLPGLYGLLLTQIGVFLVDKVMRHPIIRRSFYLHHHAKLQNFWQPITSLFCHRDVSHLSNNLFLLLLLGRSVEVEFGRKGLLFSFLCCGAFTSAVALSTLPKYTTSIGAAGALMGLFFVSSASAFEAGGLLNWRTILDFVIMGFYIFRQFAIEVSTTAFGGKRSVKLGLHVAGAVVGAAVSRWWLTSGHQLRSRTIGPSYEEYSDYDFQIQ